MRTPHSSTNKGKTVYIILRDGSHIVDKFLDKKSGTIILEKHGKLSMKDVRSFSHRKLKD